MGHAYGYETSPVHFRGVKLSVYVSYRSAWGMLPRMSRKGWTSRASSSYNHLLQRETEQFDPVEPDIADGE